MSALEDLLQRKYQSSPGEPPKQPSRQEPKVAVTTYASSSPADAERVANVPEVRAVEVEDETTEGSTEATKSETGISDLVRSPNQEAVANQEAEQTGGVAFPMESCVHSETIADPACFSSIKVVPEATNQFLTSYPDVVAIQVRQPIFVSNDKTSELAAGEELAEPEVAEPEVASSNLLPTSDEARASDENTAEDSAPPMESSVPEDAQPSNEHGAERFDDHEEETPFEDLLSALNAIPSTEHEAEVASTVEQESDESMPADDRVQDEQEPSSGVESSASIEFKPEWEIDRFPWPGICDQILEQVGPELQSLTQHVEGLCQIRQTNVVAVTSAEAGVGRTTMCMCLAREAARQGRSVAIVEMDHERPTMLAILGIEFEHGVESLQQGSVTARSICVSAVEEGVALLPAAKPFHPSQCGTEEFQAMLSSVSQHFDLVYIDATREVVDELSKRDSTKKLAVLMVSEPQLDHATQSYAEWMKDRDAWTLGIIENFAA